MIRRTIIDEIAEEEIRNAKQLYAARSPQRAGEFLSQVRVTIRATQEFPFAKAIQEKVEDMEIRRVRVAHFPYFLFYFVYPSVDMQTGEALDVVYFLACRHERQGEPIWMTRDPLGPNCLYSSQYPHEHTPTH